MAEKEKNCHVLITSPLNEGGRDKRVRDWAPAVAHALILGARRSVFSIALNV